MPTTLNPSALIAALRTATSYTVTDYTAVPPVNGRVQPATAATRSIVAVVAPVVGNVGADLQMLPEGRRARDKIEIYTTSVLSVGADGTTAQASRIAYDSKAYEVQSVERWDGGTVTFYRAVAELVTP